MECDPILIKPNTEYQNKLDSLNCREPLSMHSVSAALLLKLCSSHSITYAVPAALFQQTNKQTIKQTNFQHLSNIVHQLMTDMYEIKQSS